MSSQGRQRLFLYLSFGIILCRTMLALAYPRLSSDGPWALSPVFSYMIGKGDYSLFGGEFLGPVLKSNTIDFIFSGWFRVFGINTWSFILLGSTTLLATVSIWHILLRRQIEGNGWMALIPLSYALSGYVYMYRAECFCILPLSLMLLCLKRLDNEVLRWVSAAGMAVLAGLNHPLGGVFGCIVLGYFLLQGRYGPRYYLMAAGISIGMALLLSGGHLIGYLESYMARPADAESHFSGVDLSLIWKYFILGSPFIILMLPMVFVRCGIFGRLTLGIALMVLLISSRSYYFPYLHVVVLATALFEKPASTNLIKPYETLLRLSLAYSWIAFLLIPIAECTLSYREQSHWWKVLAGIDQEEKTWRQDSTRRYYVPSQLSMEVYDNEKARLLYNWMYKDFGIQDARSRVFYIYSKRQREWIDTNFRSDGARWETSEIVPPERGSLKPSSFYRLKPVYDDSIGLWRVRAVIDPPTD